MQLGILTQNRKEVVFINLLSLSKFLLVLLLIIGPKNYFLAQNLYDVKIKETLNYENKHELYANVFVPRDIITPNQTTLNNPEYAKIVFEINELNKSAEELIHEISILNLLDTFFLTATYQDVKKINQTLGINIENFLEKYLLTIDLALVPGNKISIYILKEHYLRPTIDKRTLNFSEVLLQQYQNTYKLVSEEIKKFKETQKEFSHAIGKEYYDEHFDGKEKEIKKFDTFFQEFKTNYLIGKNPLLDRTCAFNYYERFKINFKEHRTSNYEVFVNLKDILEIDYPGIFYQRKLLDSVLKNKKKELNDTKNEFQREKEKLISNLKFAYNQNLNVIDVQTIDAILIGQDLLDTGSSIQKELTLIQKFYNTDLEINELDENREKWLVYNLDLYKNKIYQIKQMNIKLNILIDKAKKINLELELEIDSLLNRKIRENQNDMTSLVFLNSIKNDLEKTKDLDNIGQKYLFLKSLYNKMKNFESWKKNKEFDILFEKELQEISSTLNWIKDDYYDDYVSINANMKQIKEGIDYVKANLDKNNSVLLKIISNRISEIKLRLYEIMNENKQKVISMLLKKKSYYETGLFKQKDSDLSLEYEEVVNAVSFHDLKLLLDKRKKLEKELAELKAQLNDNLEKYIINNLIVKDEHELIEETLISTYTLNFHLPFDIKLEENEQIDINIDTSYILPKDTLGNYDFEISDVKSAKEGTAFDTKLINRKLQIIFTESVNFGNYEIILIAKNNHQINFNSSYEILTQNENFALINYKQHFKLDKKLSRLVNYFELQNEGSLISCRINDDFCKAEIIDVNQKKYVRLEYNDNLNQGNNKIQLLYVINQPYKVDILNYSNYTLGSVNYIEYSIKFYDTKIEEVFYENDNVAEKIEYVEIKELTPVSDLQKSQKKNGFSLKFKPVLNQTILKVKIAFSGKVAVNENETRKYIHNYTNLNDSNISEEKKSLRSNIEEFYETVELFEEFLPKRFIEKVEKLKNKIIVSNDTINKKDVENYEILKLEFVDNLKKYVKNSRIYDEEVKEKLDRLRKEGLEQKNIIEIKELMDTAIKNNNKELENLAGQITERKEKLNVLIKNLKETYETYSNGYNHRDYLYLFSIKQRDFNSLIKKAESLLTKNCSTEVCLNEINQTIKETELMLSTMNKTLTNIKLSTMNNIDYVNHLLKNSNFNESIKNSFNEKITEINKRLLNNEIVDSFIASEKLVNEVNKLSKSLM
ncbi:MAG: hypothetical protein N3E37_02890, partial [Candidatus Micrarchaeota archaeon]|nr:hypothetical protein [Candidatus Micrarchaeota archaeon]